MEEGESLSRRFRRTTRIRGQPYVTEWLRGLDAMDIVASPPPVTEAPVLSEQLDQFSSQPTIEASPTSVPLAARLPELQVDPSVEGEQWESEMHLLQPTQLQREMGWMGEFNRTLDTTIWLDDPDYMVSQYMQEQPQELVEVGPELQEEPKPNPEDDTDEEDPAIPDLNAYESYEEESRDANLEADSAKEHPHYLRLDAEPGEEILHDVDRDEELLVGDQVLREEEEVGGDEGLEGEEDEQQVEEDEDEDDEGKVADEEVGTESPTSTITTV